MKRCAVLLALLVAGCGATTNESARNDDERYVAWRTGVERICKDLRVQVEKLPNPSEEIGDGSDLDQLRDLGAATRPIAALYVEAARATSAVARPVEGKDVADAYVEAFDKRARNYAELSRASSAADRAEAVKLLQRDERFSRGLAYATENARVDC